MLLPIYDQLEDGAEKAALDEAVRAIISNPEMGPEKRGDLEGIRVHKYRFNRHELLLPSSASKDEILFKKECVPNEGAEVTAIHAGVVAVVSYDFLSVPFRPKENSVEAFAFIGKFVFVLWVVQFADINIRRWVVPHRIGTGILLRDWRFQ